MSRDRRRPAGIVRTVRMDEGSSPRREVLSALGVQRPCLVVLGGAELGRRVTLEGSHFLVGRDPEADLTLADVKVSFHHCRLEDRGDGWALVDEGSTNGVRVNGAEVEERTLADKDKIEVGDTLLRFELQDGADRAFDEMVQRMIDVDDLTGLLQRRRFDRELDKLLAAARAREEPVGLLVMDLDGLKAINDTHGHLFGAYTIAESGMLIGRMLPRGGIGSRFGGDEYVAALPGQDLARTAAFAERLVEAIASHPFEKEGVGLRPGISIGVAVFPAHAEDALALFQRADEAMYSAKRAGKGCARVFGQNG